MEATKRLLLVAAAVAVGLMIVVAYLAATLRDAREIARVKAERDYLIQQRDAIETFVAKNDSLVTEIGKLRLQVDEEVDRRLAVVDSLERELEENELTVRSIRKRADLEATLAETFPEIVDSDWGVREVYNEAEDVSVEYVLIPLWFTETFILDRLEVITREIQVDTLQGVIALKDSVVLLADSVTSLERANRFAYQEGYNDVFGRYGDLSDRYIRHLEQPRFSVKVPSLPVILLATGAGIFIGTRFD